MTRQRWRITVLAALATFAAVFPITDLFRSDAWLPRAVVVITLVAVVGVAGRSLTRSRTLVVLSQLVIVGYAVIAQFAAGTLSYGVPTRETWELIGGYGAQALETVQTYTAPAPLTVGVSFCLLVAIALVAVAVDAMAATWRSPAAAGLPLLTAYLITAANGNEALQLRYFVVPVVLWLIMLHTTARAQFSRWSTTSSTGTTPAGGPGGLGDRGVDPGATVGDDRRAERSFTSNALKLGAVGVVIAALLPAAIPHFAPRYLTDGLGQRAGGSGQGSVGFNDTIDLTKSLNNTDRTPVLRYTTTGSGRARLRVLATSYYSRGQWLVVGRPDAAPDESPPLPPSDVRKNYVLNVTDNALEAPHIAAPYPVVAVAMSGIKWSIDPTTRDVRVAAPARSYQVTYADVTPSPPDLRKADTSLGPDVTQDDLTLPDTDRALLEKWSDEVTAGQADNLDKAIAIQNHLRDTSTYTYSLDLGPTPRDAQGRPLDPMQTFFQTKRGYCTQFASAMIFLARAQGIPARMAIGFLPGTLEGSTWVVRASDAHAWPELYFGNYGWLRFEPTPGTRSGSPPPYAVVGSSVSGGGGQAPDEAVPSPLPQRTLAGSTPESADTGTATPSRVQQFFTGPTLVLVLALLIGLLAAFMMPLTAWLDRLRRRRAATSQQELIEVEWADLTSHLRDLGIAPPPGGTLRAWREYFITEGHLDPDHATAMRRVTTTLEKARYDRPERTTPEAAQALHHDIRSVRQEITRTRAWTTRVSSFLWPSRGVAVWRNLRGSLRRPR